MTEQTDLEARRQLCVREGAAESDREWALRVQKLANDWYVRALKAEAAVLKYPEWAGTAYRRGVGPWCRICEGEESHAENCLRAELEKRK